MTAAVIQLSDYRAKQLLPEHSPLMEEGRALIVDALTRLIMEDFASLPLPTITLAIQECSRVMHDGGCFIDAFEAAADVLRRALRGSPFLWEVALLKKARMAVVEAVIRKRLQAAEYQEALMRAKRVVQGGGCISVAIYQAIGDRS